MKTCLKTCKTFNITLISVIVSDPFTSKVWVWLPRTNNCIFLFFYLQIQSNSWELFSVVCLWQWNRVSGWGSKLSVFLFKRWFCPEDNESMSLLALATTLEIAVKYKFSMCCSSYVRQINLLWNIFFLSSWRLQCRNSMEY